MTKKVNIKIVNKDIRAWELRDTTQGGIYEAHIWNTGDVDNEGVHVDSPALSFVDDAGDVVGLYLNSPAFVVVEDNDND